MADVLQIRDLRVYLDVDAGTVKAVDGISFRIPEGGTVALVGESGSGKTMVAQAVLSILPRVAHIESGEILFHDPGAPAPRPTSPSSTRKAARCARSAAGASRSSSRSR
jgi:peptide/nickel transport system ATP-binding protein